jgi:branched-chain amino acid aminotransferase
VAFVYYQGAFIEDDTPLLRITDRSFRFGDGIFETIFIYNGQMVEAAAHFARLDAGMAHYRLQVAEKDALPALCEQIIQRNGLDTGYVRIIISRGDNLADGIGYAPPPGLTATVLIQTIVKPFPAFKPITLWLSRQPVSFRSPCKTTSALHYVMAMREAQENGCDNALLLNAHEHLCDSRCYPAKSFKNMARQDRRGAFHHRRVGAGG